MHGSSFYICRMASTPSTSSSRAASREPQQKRRRITRDEEIDEAICVGLRESSKRWERKAEAESAEKNADMYFGKNVGETLHQRTPRQLPKQGFSTCYWKCSSLRNHFINLPLHTPNLNLLAIFEMQIFL